MQEWLHLENCCSGSKYIVYVYSNKNIYDLDKILEDRIGLIPFILYNRKDHKDIVCKNMYSLKNDMSLVELMIKFEDISDSDLMKSLNILVFNKKNMENITPILFYKDNNNYQILENELFN